MFIIIICNSNVYQKNEMVGYYVIVRYLLYAYNKNISLLVLKFLNLLILLCSSVNKGIQVFRANIRERDCDQMKYTK